jgi:hypothetical protein
MNQLQIKHHLNCEHAKERIDLCKMHNYHECLEDLISKVGNNSDNAKIMKWTWHDTFEC